MENSSSRLYLQISQRAMATDFEVLLPRDTAGPQVEAAVAALDRLESIENALTIYQPHSQLSLLNRDAAERPVRVDAMLWEIFEVADQAYRLTDGAFDITAGPLVEAWGFTSRSGRRPQVSEIQAALACVGWGRVKRSPEQRTVEFEKSGMRINLGAIGKGYALDWIARRLREAGLQGFLIHGGNSSVLAWGDSVLGSGDGWKIGVQNPMRSGDRVAGIVLKNQAIATSGSGKRFFHFGGKRYGHVIDPRNGYPVDHFQSLTIVAQSAMLADALSTGLFVAGRECLERVLNQDHSLAGVALVNARRQGEVAIEVWNLPDNQWITEAGGRNATGAESSTDSSSGGMSS